jgi:vacuolar-type H+-ATPase catalytic subunit A/Vma1
MSQTIYKHVFAVGDLVSWTSQAGGFHKTKTGTVIEVVATGKPPNKYGTTGTRQHESYVVEVPREPGRKTLKSDIYWPVRSQLVPARKPNPKLALDKSQRERMRKLDTVEPDRPDPNDENAIDEGD